MKRIEILPFESQYKNAGQRAEQKLRYTLTGTFIKADNTPNTIGGDCGDIQIKSARATICKGLDLLEYLMTDGATRYAYVMKDERTAYIMNRDEYIEFCTAFATVTRDSEKNGGGLKLRLKSEGKAMRAWFGEA